MKGIRSERSGHEDNGKIDPVQEIVYSRLERKGENHTDSHKNRVDDSGCYAGHHHENRIENRRAASLKEQVALCFSHFLQLLYER